MNKAALKTFAISARKELLKKVEAKAMKIGIKEDNIKKADIESSDAIFIDGKQLSKEEKIQRDKLIVRINQIGYTQVMEEVAYTWFNRFTALRYMEVNDYLPTNVRVLSSENADSAEPDMINDALSLELEIDKEYVYDLKINSKTEELFKYLIIKHCNDLNRYLPFMFETIDDYTEILFPEGLLAKESFIRRMTDIEFIPEDNWKKVEVIGWLYQYYIAEEKDRVIRAKKKYKTEEIPFATQLFTPGWIVRYMVQNSLGRYWVESHPEHRDLLKNWEFYLENPNQEDEFDEKLAPYINKELKVEEIKCFDPAMGSGHILVYMFDVLYEIYSKCGYMEREIPRLIIENNLYGLDIDDRAYQLACFSVVMKALEYNSRFFRSIEREGITLNLTSIQETNTLHDEDIAYIAGENSGESFNKIKEFIERFKDAKTIGSLIRVENYDDQLLKERLEYIQLNPAENLFEEEIRKKILLVLPNLLKQAEIMIKNYGVLVTNPPYMGNGKMNKVLSNYLNSYYGPYKADTFSAFMKYCLEKVDEKGHLGFITPFVWLYLSSYVQTRKDIVEEKNISSLVELEYNAFPEACVTVCTFTLRNYNVPINGEYIRLSDFPGIEVQESKTLEAINQKVNYRYSVCSNEFNKIDESPISYWISKNALKAFENCKPLSYYANAKKGMNTSNNDYFLRLWFEVDYKKLGVGYKDSDAAQDSRKKWFPYNKGGGYKKWYGSNEWVINYENDGHEVKTFEKSDIRSPQLYFRDALTWSAIGATKPFSIRFSDYGAIFDSAGSSVFGESDEELLYLMGILQSKVTYYFLRLLNPSVNYGAGTISKVPVLINEERKHEVIELVKRNIELSRENWNHFEKSFGFKRNPLLTYDDLLISKRIEEYDSYLNKIYEKIKLNEESINKIIAGIYDLQDDITVELTSEEVTIIKPDNKEHTINLISYAVGCMFGRYSLVEDGIVFAGGEMDLNKYSKDTVDKDNILPILPGSYFEDDIVVKLIEFIKNTFGEAMLAQNLEFIAGSLGKKKGETAKETIRRYFLNDFFKDHVNIFSTRGRKAPIYWLFSSGKQKAFNCLVYIHRYDKTTLSRIRTDYLHEYQIRLDAERKSLVNVTEEGSTVKEISNAKKEIKVLDKKIEELKDYDELLHHMADMQIEIDLDDGVTINYEKFKGLVAKI
ncbi:BREX-1 system adenine-specific DNA-methyltransferase PglX [Priestia aryabhattai]|uniref:BREX-1 system adenine-specific DNA-methyltransferase PglX n=1 Tax=Priestia aryabhattai TaxID=412384 RepID=UPI00203A9899|nr:BREX-1 system adenine-specific DNA-methyltransferase PglX [Priestia aryabhattai]MCM3255568.1 BREX-1 system adenine-specific DNA-methyltransferase PglX [Priestia aryabhattai]